MPANVPGDFYPTEHAETNLQLESNGRNAFIALVVNFKFLVSNLLFVSTEEILQKPLRSQLLLSSL